MEINSYVRERGNLGEFFGILILIALCVGGVLFLIGGLNLNTTRVILERVEQGKPVGLFMVINNADLPEEIRSQYDQAVMAKYISLLGDDLRIPKKGWSFITASRAEIEARNCGDLTTASPIFHGFQPKIGSIEAGEKVYLLPMGLTGVGSGGCEVGTFVASPDYDPNFKPFTASGLNPLEIANCQLRIWMGMNYYETTCMDSGFRPSDNWIRNTPVPNAGDSGLYIVFAFAQGVWVDSIETSMLGTTFQHFNVDTTAVDSVRQFLSEGFGNGQ